MRDPSLLWFASLIGLPLLGALAAGALRRRAADVAALVALTAAAAVAIALVARHGVGGLVVRLGSLPAVDRLAGHAVPLFGFGLDALSALVLLGAVVLGALCALYSVGYVSKRNRETPADDDRHAYWFWLLLFVGSMSGLVTSLSLVQTFVFWELTTVCSWALIGFYEDEPGAQAAARKAFLTTAGGGLALFGAALAVLALTGRAGFDAFGALPAGVQGSLALLLLVLVMAGAWAKSAQVPFHAWLPSAMVAPSPVSAYLHAASMVNAGVYLALRLALANAPPPAPLASADPLLAAVVVPPAHPLALAAIVGAMATVTLVVSVARFFAQDDLKRLLALSTASHLALILLGAALAFAGAWRAAQGAALHVLAHGVGKALLFLSVGTLSYAAGTRHIRDLRGAGALAPVAALGFLVGALTVTGVPPFAGFWSKLLLVTGAVQLGGWGTAAGALIVVESVVAFAWMLWVGQRVFLGEPSSRALAMGPRSASMEATLVVLMVLCLVVTLAGLPLASAVRPGPFGG